MQTFISETLKLIISQQKSFENSIIVLPSQRAGVFLKQELKKELSVGFLPRILNIEEFIEEVTSFKKIDTVQLLFHFYTVYKNTEKQTEAFDSFFSWAITVLQDFNEVDQHLVNSKDLFNYIKDIERLKNWSVDKPIEETKLMKNHFSFMEKLDVYYSELYKYLTDRKIGYQGLIYREAAREIEEYARKNNHKKFYFIGFNALNKAEEYLFQQMLIQGNTELFWDIDEVFLNSKHQAGTFIRRYKSDWKYYLTNPIKIISSTFHEQKNIEIIGASKNVTQIKYAGEIIKKLTSQTNTAYVLADESLLPITLNSLPKEVEAVNITMGYPLKDIPTTSLFTTIFQLFLNQDKLQRTALKQFYYKDILQFLKHPVILPLLLVDKKSLFDNIAFKISQDNDAFINIKQLTSFLSKLEENSKNTLLGIFKPFTSTEEFIQRILSLILLVKENVTALEKEYLYRFFGIFTQLQNLQTEYNYLKNLKTIQQLFNQLIQSENISFQGEPLKGLQLMGMLETRVLDFENVIITSVNENILPKGTTQSSFIPFDVKIDFGLPTYKEKDAIFSYHFFRLLQRAKNIYLLYNSENDNFGGGEKSRFISQLQQLKSDIKEKQISPNIVTEKKELIEIVKTNEILEKLKKQAIKGFSPSTLTNYLYNPLDFYKHKILGIKEYKEVEETIAANTMGTIIHDTLDALYKPLIGKIIIKNDFKKLLLKIEELVILYFKKYFHNSDVFTGKNRLIFEISKNYIERFILNEITALNETDELIIIATEKDLETQITIEGLDFPIKLRGQVDRIDKLNGVTRIIDYKTGNVTASSLKVPNISEITEEKYSKAIQVLLYAYLYNENFETANLESGIISFKNLNSGLLKVDFSKKEHNINQEKLDEFISSIKKLILEIFNVKIPFTEKIH